MVSWFCVSQSDAEALERETRRIGRALVRTGDTEEDDQDEDDEITDIEASNITLTPLLRYLSVCPVFVSLKRVPVCLPTY